MAERRRLTMVGVASFSDLAGIHRGSPVVYLTVTADSTTPLEDTAYVV
jgi:hypothetical protein